MKPDCSKARNRVPLCVVSAGSIALCMLLSAQTKGHPEEVSTVADVLNLAADSKAEVHYQSVHKVLNSLPEPDRTTILRKLIVGSNLGLATEAASRAIKAHDLESADVIASRIVSWPSYQQGAILSEIAPAKDGFIEVPRQLVRSTINAAKLIPETDLQADPVSLAALLLARSGKQPDRQMLVELTKIAPHSWGVWMAIAHSGIIDAPSTVLAASIYRDATAPLTLRVAVATALAPVDANAAAYATTEIQSFLAQFAGHELGSLIGGLRQGPDSDEGRAYRTYLYGFRLLSSLQELKDGLAQPIVFRYLNSPNEEIRDLCGIIAAKRWPDKFLSAGQGASSEREHQHLLALVARQHPELAATVASKMTPAAMSQAESDIASIGLGFFSTPGNILKFF